MGLRGYITIGVGLVIVAGLSGCAAAIPVALTGGAYGAAMGSESRSDIEKQTMKNCDLFADKAKQASCKDKSAIAFDACDEIEGARAKRMREKRGCFMDVFNGVRQNLIEDCNGNTACLEKIPPEKIKYE